MVAVLERDIDVLVLSAVVNDPGVEKVDVVGRVNGEFELWNEE